MSLGNIQLLALIELEEGEEYGPWDMKISMTSIIFMIVEFFLYTILVFVLERALNNENFMRYWTN